jgi:hypothetical protein
VKGVALNLTHSPENIGFWESADPLQTGAGQAVSALKTSAERATVLDDEEVEEPPCLGLFVLGTVNDCCTHGKASFFDWVTQQGG